MCLFCPLLIEQIVDLGHFSVVHGKLSNFGAVFRSKYTKCVKAAVVSLAVRLRNDFNANVYVSLWRIHVPAIVNTIDLYLYCFVVC